MAVGEPQRPAATSREALKWLPPLGEALKINVDGAFINHSGEAAAGVVVRNSKGEVLLSASRCLINCRDAEHAEALACLVGARLAQRWRMANLFLEADCSTVIDKLAANCMDRSVVGPIIRDIGEEIKNLNSISFSKVRREQNKVAHELAHLAIRTGNSQVFVESVPECASTLVCNELVA
ncbi:unnamed protein product [Urochloa humidicola]